jgi:2-methylfumaryl-CoA hydratase
VFAWSKVLACAEVPGRKDCGLLRLRTVATKDLPCATFPDKSADGQYPENVILDLDYWAVMPRK